MRRVLPTLVLLLAAGTASADPGVITLSSQAREQVIESERIQGDTANTYWLAVGGEADGLFQLEVRPNERTMHTHVRLADGDEGTLAEAYADEDGKVTRMEVAVGPGRYKLEIDDSHRVTRLKPYRLTARFEPVSDRYEPNNSFETAKPLTVGKPIEITLFRFKEADEDYFTVDHPGGALQIAVSGHTRLTPNVKIFNSDREEVGFGQAANEAASLRHEEELPAGRYTLVFADASAANLPTRVRVDITRR